MKYDDSVEHYCHNGSICVNCGVDHEEDTGVCACDREGRWVADPFDEEINGLISYRFMCDDCERESGESI
jgi:hypothetical protein